MAKVERKNFLKEYKLFAACAKADSFRDNMERVYFHHGNAYATNGHILVCVPLTYCSAFEPEQIEALNGFCVHQKILKLIYGFDVVTVERTLTTEDAYDNPLEAAEPVVYIKAVYQGEQVRFRLEKSDKDFVANFDTLMATETGYKPLNQIGLNAANLAKISAALNMDQINMAFTTADKKIFISSTNEEDIKAGPHAIIMPVVTDACLPGMDGDEEEEGNE